MGSPDDRRYQKTHEWARVVNGEVAVGITAFAIEELQDLVFLDLPEVGASVEAGTPFGEIESVKAVSDLVAPVTGTVTAVNEALQDQIESLNDDAYDGGWMLRIKVTGSPEDAIAQLLSAADYDALTAGADH
jgi:glycine cleavage system H protein